MTNPRQNKSTDFLTVILLCFNRKNYSQLALAAIQNQTHKAIKIIIVDNHSTDGTEEILPLLIKDDPRAIYLRLDKNSNAANSYMTGIALAQTEFVLVTHDDDILHSTYVSRIVEEIKKDQEIGMVACNATLIDSKGEIINPRLYDLSDDLKFNIDEYIKYYCKNKLWLPTPSLCFRKRLHQDILVKTRFPMTTQISDIGKDLNSREIYKPSGDIDFCVKLNRIQKICLIADPLISYRQHSKQESRNVNQYEPMVNTMKSLRASYKKNDEVFGKIDSLFAKYSIQMYLMNGDQRRLRNFLRKKTKTKINEFIAIGQRLYFDDDNSFENCKFTDENYELLSSKIIRKGSLVNLDSVRPKNILVGSMLMSFLIYKRLKKDSAQPIRVMDMSPSRIGQKFFDVEVESYEALFSSITKIEDYCFIVTSERDKDSSIPALIRSFNENAHCVFWQDL